jgi:hypothetical protein
MLSKATAGRLFVILCERKALVLKILWEPPNIGEARLEILFFRSPDPDCNLVHTSRQTSESDCRLPQVR